MKTLCRLSLACLFTARLALSADQPSVTVQGSVLDADSGAPLPARVYVQSEAGKWFTVKSASPSGSAIELRRQASPKSFEHHTTLSAHPFTAFLPPGRYTFSAHHGKEFFPAQQSITVGAAPANVTLKLKRWIDMPARGWFSGDTHSHRPLTEMTNVLLAEDVNIGFPLTQWVTVANTTPLQANKAAGPTPRADLSIIDKAHLLYPLNTEYEIFTTAGKSHTLGAFLILGHKTPFDLGVPPVAPVAARARREGALIDLEKHSWPWSIAMVPILNVDLFELSNNHVWRTEFGFPKWTLGSQGQYMKIETDANGFTEWGWLDFGFQTYYAFLNSGFRIRPTAGTAAGVHPVPFGFGRVYVHQPGGFTGGNWMKALNEGRSFVTTGPMLFVSVNGAGPGSVVNGEASEARVSATIESIAPLDHVEIILNGRVVKTLSPSNPSTAGVFKNVVNETFPLTGSSWVAVRAFEKNNGRRNIFAHSSPIYLDIPNRPLRPRREEIDYLISRVKEEIVRNQTILPREALQEYESALAIYERIGRGVQ